MTSGTNSYFYVLTKKEWEFKALVHVLCMLTRKISGRFRICVQALVLFLKLLTKGFFLFCCSLILMLLTDLVAEIQPPVIHRADITAAVAFSWECSRSYTSPFGEHLLRNVENLVSVLTQSLDYFLRLCKIFWLHCHISHHSLETEHWPLILYTVAFSFRLELVTCG